jgi:hypothetical protein
MFYVKNNFLYIGESKATGRNLLLVMAPGFHFISQAPFDAGRYAVPVGLFCSLIGLFLGLF